MGSCMGSCTIVYLGKNTIATNALNITKSQKAKRMLLRMHKHYDVLPIDYVEIIHKKYDKLFITGLNKKVANNKFFFNYLIECGVDMGKVTTLNGTHSICTRNRGKKEKEERFSDLLADGGGRMYRGI